MKRRYLCSASRRHAGAAGTALIVLAFSQAHAQTLRTWISGTEGNFGTAENYVDGIAPVAGDSVDVNGAGSVVEFTEANTITLVNLRLAEPATGGTPVFNHTGGDLTLTGLLQLSGGGASRNPTYNLSGGTLTTPTLAWSQGSNVTYNQTGGVADITGTADFNIARRGSFSLANDAVFNAAATGAIFTANGGGAVGNVFLGGTARFNAPDATFVVGQFGDGASATLLIQDAAELTVEAITVGNNNAGSATNGMIYLDGGVITTGSIHKGASSLTAGPTQLALIANGGTVRASAHANNANFFQNLYVDLDAGGLTFDTNDNFVIIANTLHGTGGLTKTGGDALQLNGFNTYSGDTVVEQGTLVLNSASLHDESALTVADDAVVDLLHGVEDRVASLTLGTQTFTTGTFGSPFSNADNKSDYFAGTGLIRLGEAPEGRELVWTGAESSFWGTLFAEDNFVLAGTETAAAFQNGDHVTFDDSGVILEPEDPSDENSPLVPRPVNIDAVQPGSTTVEGTADWIFQASTGGIAGDGGITSSTSGTVSLGGTNTFLGPVEVNAGRIVMTTNQALGNSSGVTVAEGAQVDIGGAAPGALYTFTIAGDGPDGAGAITNTGGEVFSASPVKDLVLAGDASIGGDGARFDIGGGGGILTANGHTLTKTGTNTMGFRADAEGAAIVIEEGSVFGQGSGNAFGGTSGSLTIRNGARAGSWQSLTIPTAVTIEDGGALYNQGAGTGTWSGAFTLQGNVTVDAGDGPIQMTGAVSGTANLTKTGGNTLTLANPGHAGDTTVDAGTLSLGAAGLADTGNVAVNGTAVLDLAHGAEDTVATLTFDGQPAATGTWGAPGSGAANIDEARFTGSGTLLVLDQLEPPAGYASWAAGFGLEGAEAAPDADPDGDGIANALEFVLGGDPTLPSQDLLPTVSANGETVTFTFLRDDASETSGTAVSVQHSDDLETWTTLDIGAASAGEVTIEENGDEPDLVTVTLPKNGDTHLFLRLRVVVD